MKKHNQQIVVWDVFVRLFHWGTVIGFICAYFTAEFNEMDLHALIGYGLTTLLLLRLIWGIVGTQYARFSSFIFSPRVSWEYLRSMRSGEPTHYYGHNPAGALMVFALMGSLLLLFTTGLISLAVIEFEGPLLGLTQHFSDELSYLIREIHELLVWLMFVLISFHLLGVIVASKQHKENLARAMITGKKDLQTCRNPNNSEPCGECNEKSY